MTNSVERVVPQSEAGDTRPAYKRPVLIELDADETATGIISGTPENSTYTVT